jgi:excisionase family DNA binding protein
MQTEVLAKAVGPIPFPTFFTLPELAELLQVEERELKRMVGTHELAAVWVGGDYRVLTKDLIEWLLVQRQPGGNRDESQRRRRR